MKVLLDNNINQLFAGLLSGHVVVHARDLVWGELGNGKLIAHAEALGFDVMVTADKLMRNQQNLPERKSSILVLDCLLIKWIHIEPLAPRVQALLDSPPPQGSFISVVR